MIKNKKNLISNYTEKDLLTFTTLENFSDYNANLTKTNNKQHVNQSGYYTFSDNKKFMKLMNFNLNTKDSFKEDSISEFFNNYDLPSKIIGKNNDSFYNESDIQNFENLKQYPPSNSSDSLQYTSKKEDLAPTITNYTSSDLEAFDRIVELTENSTKEQITVKNINVDKLKAKIDTSSIKIIDFDKLKKRETRSNKKGVKKIKVVHFD